MNRRSQRGALRGRVRLSHSRCRSLSYSAGMKEAHDEFGAGHRARACTVEAFHCRHHGERRGKGSVMNRRRFIVPLTLAIVTLCSAVASEAATRARARGQTVINDAPVRVAAGNLHTCQIKEDGTVRCWG